MYKGKALSQICVSVTASLQLFPYLSVLLLSQDLKAFLSHTKITSALTISSAALRMLFIRCAQKA